MIQIKMKLSVIAVLFLLSFYTYSNLPSKKIKEKALMNNMDYAENIASYTIEDGSRFKLCRDFADYVNRQPPFYYYLGLKPDPLFKNFKIPYLNEVDKNYGLSVVKKKIDTHFEQRLAKISDEQKKIELVKKHKKGWLKSLYLNEETKFYTAKIDVNHTGKKNDILISKLIYPLTKRNADFKQTPIGLNNSLVSYTRIDDEGNYKHGESFRLRSGHPFFYQGRFYTARFGYAAGPGRTRLTVDVHEPKKTFATKEGVYSGRAVCQFEMLND